MSPASRFASLLLAVLVAGCQSGPSDDILRARAALVQAEGPKGMRAQHTGPAVAHGATGTARFASKVFTAFRPERAFEATAFADRFYREPGNEGFEAVLDHVKHELELVGYGSKPGFELEVIESPRKQPAWTPRSARLSFTTGGGSSASAEPIVLHHFEKSEDQDRTMLPVNAPSAKVAGRLVTDPDAIEPGTVFLSPRGLSGLDEAKEKGAVLVLASDLAAYCIDPTGKERHRDAIGYRSVRHPAVLPVCQISPRSAEALKAALAQSAPVIVSFECATEFTTDRPLRTLVATVVGAKAPDQCVVTVAHVQEPGACDNASGIGTLLEGARVLAALRESDELRPPARSIVMLWGLEMQESRVWLEAKKRTTFAAVAADMTGESRTITGAVARLERLADPGAVKPLPPDEHTPWGTTVVEAESLRPNGLSIVARSALLDVAALAPDWVTAENPYEGGSDHDVFLSQGIPAVLFWHFTDFAYHTSLDRLDHVDPDEMRRTGAAILATVLALADPEPGDLARHLESLKIEIVLRLAACETAGDAATAALWTEWSNGARQWLRALCLGEDKLPVPNKSKENVGSSGEKAKS